MTKSLRALLIPYGPTDHVLGAADATVVILEYGDFECSLCAQAHAALKIVFAHYSPQLSIAFRHFPRQEVHPKAELAAEAAEAAAAQGKFWQMHDLLFKNQRRLDQESLCDYAEQIELDVRRFDNELATHVHLPRVRDQAAIAKQIPVRASPAFYVNGLYTDVSFGLLRLQEAVHNALSRTVVAQYAASERTTGDH